MAVIEWIRFLAGAGFMLMGLGIFAIEMIGVFRFRYVLNRMHAAAMGDTLGIGYDHKRMEFYYTEAFSGNCVFMVFVSCFFSSDRPS